MSGVQIKIDTKGIEEVESQLLAIAARGERLRPVLGVLGTALVGIVHTNFDVGGRPKWKPLSVKTVWSYQENAVQQVRNTKKYQNAKKASTRSKYEDQAVQKRMGNKILVQSGSLRQSITLGRVTDASIEIGSSLPYARIQQLGGTIGPVTVTPRSKKALLIPAQYGYILRRSANVPERKIPARPYLAVSAEDIPLLTGITMAYLRGGTVLP